MTARRWTTIGLLGVLLMLEVLLAFLVLREADSTRDGTEYDKYGGSCEGRRRPGF